MRPRFGFTLLELLVIIGILGILAAVSVASLGKGTGAARMRGSVRDVFATVRIARSTALVTQKPCVMSFSTQKGADGEWVSKVEVVSAIKKSSGITMARTIGGEWRSIGNEDGGVEMPAERNADGAEEQSAPVQEGGETIEEMLFEPVSEEVFKGVCLKVLTADEQLAPLNGEVDEAKRSTISVFSNVDYLLGKYRQEKDKKKAAAAEQGETAPSAAAGTETDGESQEKAVAWQTNGRCEPHTIYIYAAGTDPAADGWRITIDRFGAAKILAPGEIEE